MSRFYDIYYNTHTNCSLLYTYMPTACVIFFILYTFVSLYVHVCLLYYTTDPCGSEASYTVPGPRGRRTGALLRPHTQLGNCRYHTLYDSAHVIQYTHHTIVHNISNSYLLWIPYLPCLSQLYPSDHIPLGISITTATATTSDTTDAGGEIKGLN